ncbi:MAG: hypothetical protein KUG77_11495 [Nannocystaceae bacterium]|nr:hypothetical protein [Nannocystaceae bacterium]
MSLLALHVLDVAIFGTMGGLWIFGAAFIYFVWRWAMRTEAERANPVMHSGEPSNRAATPLAGHTPTPLPAKTPTDIGPGLPSPAST